MDKETLIKMVAAYEKKADNLTVDLQTKDAIITMWVEVYDKAVELLKDVLKTISRDDPSTPIGTVLGDIEEFLIEQEEL